MDFVRNQGFREITGEFVKWVGEKKVRLIWLLVANSNTNPNSPIQSFREFSRDFTKSLTLRIYRNIHAHIALLLRLTSSALWWWRYGVLLCDRTASFLEKLLHFYDRQEPPAKGQWVHAVTTFCWVTMLCRTPLASTCCGSALYDKSTASCMQQSAGLAASCNLLYDESTATRS